MRQIFPSGYHTTVKRAQFSIVSLVLLTSLGLLITAPAFAAQEQAQTKHSETLAITLRASRPQVPAGAGFGIAADIKNKSDAAVFLVPRYVTMAPPPEIDPAPPPRVWFALIPGMAMNDKDSDYDSVVRLGPGDSTAAFWAGGPRNEGDWTLTRILSHCLSELRLLNFSPGDYNIKVVASYWPDEDSACNRINNYDSDSAEIKLTVVAPEWVIIVGSIVGGLIAYFLLPTARLRTTEINAIGICTAILLSTIVTVLLARVSETQFLVRITVNDFWGAVAIGFIANASGIAVLKKYVPSLRPIDHSGTR